MFLHEKHQSVIIFADLRFVFESPPFQIASSFALVRRVKREKNCTTRGPPINLLFPQQISELKMSFKNFSAFDKFEN